MIALIAVMFSELPSALAAVMGPSVCEIGSRGAKAAPVEETEVVDETPEAEVEETTDEATEVEATEDVAEEATDAPEVTAEADEESDEKA